MKATNFFRKMVIAAFVITGLIFSASTAFAQWNVSGTNISYNAGNVGIGTGTTAPAEKLTIAGDMSVSGIGYFPGTLRSGTSGNQIVKFGGTSATSGIQFDYKNSITNLGGIPTEIPYTDWRIVNEGDLKFLSDGYEFRNNATGTERMRIRTNGNVGIGTSSPSYKLDVNGTFRVSGSAYMNSDLNVTGTLFAVSPRFSGTTRLGNASINTYTIPGGYSLAVKGKIICEELRVQLYSNWPDYVFSTDYPLMPIEQLAAHIDEHKHLPGIPSAKEVGANGIAVGEMQAKIMEKIEELTLYLIDANEQIKALKEDRKVLEAKLESIAASNR